ncbi:MAG: hypothetical protein JJ858_03080 [Rhizobiaceae bacterium]|nr:hypothetical protein [Rhizobiaceae bacterium]
MSAQTQPHSLNQTTSAIGSEIFASFERDIEDAIFETIEDGQISPRNERKGPYHSQRPSFGKINSRDVEEENPTKAGLNIFSKRFSPKETKPFASQIALSLAVCAFTIAIVLPIVWMLSAPDRADLIANTIKGVSPDAFISTGSIAPSLAVPQIKSQDSSLSPILDKPNGPGHDKGSSLYAVGQGSVVKGSDEGSVIYFGSQD